MPEPDSIFSPESRQTTFSITSALDGEVQSMRAMLAALTPVIHARVGRALHRHRASVARDRKDDLVQDVFVELLRDGSRALRAWDPARGLSLANWVGLIADQRVAAAFRSRRRHLDAAALPLDDAPEDGARSDDDPEAAVLARDELKRHLGQLCAELSPLGRELLEALVVKEEPIATVCARMGMSTAAVQAWSSRLKRRLAELAAGRDRHEGSAAGGRIGAKAAGGQGGLHGPSLPREATRRRQRGAAAEGREVKEPKYDVSRGARRA